MLTAPFHAYLDTRWPDGRSSGQAAIATLTDVHGRDPYSLARTQRFLDGRWYWDDTAIVDAISTAGYGPDAPLPFGSTSVRIRDALRGFGLQSSLMRLDPGPWAAPGGPAAASATASAWESAWDAVAGQLDVESPVALLVDIGLLSGYGGAAPQGDPRWLVVYARDEANAHVAGAPVDARQSLPTLQAGWSSPALPTAFHWSAVFAAAMS